MTWTEFTTKDDAVLVAGLRALHIAETLPERLFGVLAVDPLA